MSDLDRLHIGKELTKLKREKIAQLNTIYKEWVKAGFNYVTQYIAIDPLTEGLVIDNEDVKIKCEEAGLYCREINPGARKWHVYASSIKWAE